jgi:type II secretory pathway component PulK
MRLAEKRPYAAKRGSILLMVLVLIIVVSYVLTKFVERAQVEVRGEGYYVERSRLRLQAWSMMEVAVAVLADVKTIDGALYSPAQGWGDPLDYAQIELPEGMNVTFEFIDESAKLGINELDEGSLFLLFDQMDFDLDVSQTLTNSLLDWIDEDDEARIDGGESREYSTADMEMHPSNQPLRSLAELSSIIGFREHFFDEYGFPNDYFRQLSEMLTHHPVALMNANAASPLALQALAGLNEIQTETIEDYIAGLDRELGTADDNYFASTGEISDVIGEMERGARITQQISVLTIKVTVQESGSAYSLIGTFNTETQATENSETGELQYPFLFLEVREEAGMNNASPS